MGVSGNLWSFLNEVHHLVPYDVECGMVLEPIERNLASSRVDLGYTVLFCIPAVTSLPFYTCDSVLANSL